MANRNRSFIALGGAAIFQLAMAIVLTIVGNTESADFFLPIIEYTVGIAYIFSLFFAAYEDYLKGTLTHILAVIIAAILIKILMGFFVKLGLWALFTGGILYILMMAFSGPGMTIFVSITSLFGVWGTIATVIAVLASFVAATMAW